MWIVPSSHWLNRLIRDVVVCAPFVKLPSHRITSHLIFYGFYGLSKIRLCSPRSHRMALHSAGYTFRCMNLMKQKISLCVFARALPAFFRSFVRSGRITTSKVWRWPFDLRMRICPPQSQIITLNVSAFCRCRPTSRVRLDVPKRMPQLPIY